MSAPAVRQRSGTVVAAICCLAVIFDGYDLSVFATTIPSLLDYKAWHLDAAGAGVIASYAFMGMLVGTLICGFATDLLGRRKMLMASMSWFSVFMVACAVAPNVELFGLFRFLSGVGLGGLLPTALALSVEFAPRDHRNLVNALVSSGFSVGTIGASLLGLVVLESFGFRPMFAFGVLPLVVLVPLAYFLLPESVAFLAAKGRLEEAKRVARQYGLDEPVARERSVEQRAGLRDLFRPPLLTMAIVFAVTTFIGQLFIYGLSTWLPQIMRSAGYPLGSALSFLATMSLGAIAGAAAMSWFADRAGPRPVAMWGFAIGVVSLVTMSAGPPTFVLYIAVALAGVGANGTSVILNGFIATWFPAANRATALGTIMTVARLGGITGPIVGGLIVSADVGVRWSFYVFVIPAAIGIALVLLLPRRHLDGRPIGVLRQRQKEPARV
ncbi:aromatic acid/H+ symport family MFS transporter [Amycolatopsis sp. K13G38]|uniref:Aromatic acid/H+ symport family MFS transporter n=1 Tax=Amycolatopsis acididurans TaxID=2724524 RepID=A0ABX1J3R6_9PSEU|nr:aromatic acid/H+ symport family MFS transporter [Amycolatopsis acididurans]NKQ54011.1 aromatic acid/H+ symport family MFS transporter [Amycolatopsis acididurans]